MDKTKVFTKGQRLYKRQKLCSQKAIDRLFAGVRTTKNSESDLTAFLVYPIRAVCMPSKRTGGSDIQFFISIPKKRLRHAVDRVTTRRRIREAYRLENIEDPARHRVDIAFIYVSDKLVDTSRIRRSMRRILDQVYKMQSTTTDENL